jgi:hypothetical protein
VVDIKFVPLDEAMPYLARHYGLKPFTSRHLRELIKLGEFPAPVPVSPGRKAFTTRQLDSYAEALLSKVGAQ